MRLMVKPKKTRPVKPKAVKPERKKQKHQVVREFERKHPSETDLQSFEHIPEVTTYRTAGKKMFIGDLKLMRMRAIIRRLSNEMGLAQQQSNEAIYLFEKARKTMPTMIDYDVIASALLYIAGRNRGLSQKTALFVPKGKGQRTQFWNLVEKIGGTKSKPVNLAIVMVKVNEILASKDIPTMTREQVNEALTHGAGYKYPEAWVIVYQFARWVKANRRWNNHDFGMTQEELASLGGGMSINTVRNLFTQALAIHGRPRHWKTTPTESEVLARANEVLRGLGLPQLTKEQVMDAKNHSPPVENPVAWAVIYHFALMPEKYQLIHARGAPGIRFKRLAMALDISDMTARHLFNQAMSRLGKAERWKSFAKQGRLK